MYRNDQESSIVNMKFKDTGQINVRGRRIPLLFRCCLKELGFDKMIAGMQGKHIMLKL